jgi:trk system potassium uptake protein TrkA
VVGCGRVGAGIALTLADEGHSVAVLDKQLAAFRRLPDDWAGQRVHGVGFDRDALEAAGVRDAGALAAVTNGDNTNIVTARIARETYQVPAVAARIYDPRRAEIFQRLGIQTVATVTWTTQQVLRRIFPERTAPEWTDPAGHVHLVERVLPDSWAGSRLSDLERPREIRLVAISRGGTTQVAASGLIGQEGDVLHVVVGAGGGEMFDKMMSSGPQANL